MLLVISARCPTAGGGLGNLVPLTAMLHSSIMRHEGVRFRSAIGRTAARSHLACCAMAVSHQSAAVPHPLHSYPGATGRMADKVGGQPRQVSCVVQGPGHTHAEHPALVISATVRLSSPQASATNVTDPFVDR